MSHHLWDYDHPYYCSESNYYASPDKGTYRRYESWGDFLVDWDALDVDMNLVFRWDWRKPDPDDYDPDDPEDPMPDHDEVFIYRMGQRKGLFTCQSVAVTEEDEAAVRVYLQPHFDRLMENWAPLTTSDPAEIGLVHNQIS